MEAGKGRLNEKSKGLLSPYRWWELRLMEGDRLSSTMERDSLIFLANWFLTP